VNEMMSKDLTIANESESDEKRKIILWRMMVTMEIFACYIK
jgi:hypothetical protein